MSYPLPCIEKASEYSSAFAQICCAGLQRREAVAKTQNRHCQGRLEQSETPKVGRLIKITLKVEGLCLLRQEKG